MTRWSQSSPRWSRRICLACLGSTAAACSLTWDPDERRSRGGAGVGGAYLDAAVGGGGASGSGATGAAGSSGSGGECGGQCVTVPEGWTGPVVRRAEVGTPLCAPPFPDTVLTLNHGLVTPGACTPCGCSVACDVVVSTFEDVDCTAEHATFDVSSSCAIQQSGGLSYRPSVNLVCAVTPAQPEPLTWTHAVRLCAPESVDGCPSGACVPTSSDPICAFRSGEHACPAGMPQRYVDYLDADDQRSCSSCTCNVTTKDCVVEAWPNLAPLCGDTPPPCASSANGSCCPKSSAANRWKGAVVSNGATCAVAGGAVVGAAVPTGARTVCCTQ